MELVVFVALKEVEFACSGMKPFDILIKELDTSVLLYLFSRT